MNVDAEKMDRASDSYKLRILAEWHRNHMMSNGLSWETEILRMAREAEINEKALLAIDKAWNVVGRNPRFHRKAQLRLLNEWPTLAKAVRGVVEARILKTLLSRP